MHANCFEYTLFCHFSSVNTLRTQNLLCFWWHRQDRKDIKWWSPGEDRILPKMDLYADLSWTWCFAMMKTSLNPDDPSPSLQVDSRSSRYSRSSWGPGRRGRPCSSGPKPDEQQTTAADTSSGGRGEDAGLLNTSLQTMLMVTKIWRHFLYY